MNDLNGKQISHYLLQEKLGQGGMGIVYKAIDQRLGRNVAIKLLPDDFANDTVHTERFINEAKVTSALDHPNICTVHEIDRTEQGQLFIVMSCYTGESLAQKLRRGKLPLEEAVDIVTQIAAGLAAAHRKDIVHRDIKPGNIFITEDGLVKLLDFGIAKIIDSELTRPDTMIGTMIYCAPEQLRKEAVDARTDIWATGVLFYQMLTGEHPFSGDNIQVTFYSILNETPRPARELNPDIPEKLEQVLDRLLQKDPDERYQDAGALSAALEPTADHSPVKMPPEREPRSRLRSIRYLSLIAAVLLLVALLIPGLIDRCTPRPRTLRVMVLPFESLNNGEENAIFAEGMTEEVINHISQLPGLEVISKTTSQYYRNSGMPVDQIGKELKLTNLVRGSVQKSGDRLRISVNLVDIQRQTNLWAESYDRQMEDIFDIQNEIAENITDSLQINMKMPLRERLQRPPTTNLEAYNLYIKGRYNWNKRTPASLQLALDFFREATEKDTAYALAYSGVADALSLFTSLEYGVVPAHITMPAAQQAAQRAVALDPYLPQAHTSLANVLLVYEWNWPAAEKEFLRAIELDPNYPTARQWYAVMLMVAGRSEEALTQIRQAQELDPSSPVINSEVGWQLRYARRYDEALAQFQENLRMDPDFVVTQVNVGYTLAAKGEFKRAADYFERARKLSGDHPLTIASLGYARGSAGDRRFAMETLKALEEIAGSGHYVHPLYFALVYLGLHDNDQVFAYLEEAYDQRAGYMIYLEVDPLVDQLRDDPRLAELMRKTGFKWRHLE